MHGYSYFSDVSTGKLFGIVLLIVKTKWYVWCAQYVSSNEIILPEGTVLPQDIKDFMDNQFN